jgi:hypothetical protein
MDDSIDDNTDKVINENAYEEEEKFEKTKYAK